MDLQHIQEIEDYLSGRISQESRREFEKRLLADPILQEEVETVRQLREGIEGYAFKKMLGDIHKENFSDDPIDER